MIMQHKSIKKLTIYPSENCKIDELFSIKNRISIMPVEAMVIFIIRFNNLTLKIKYFFAADSRQSKMRFIHEEIVVPIAIPK